MIWNRSLTAAEIQQQYFMNLRKYNETQWYLYVNQSKNSTDGLDLGQYTYQTHASDSYNWNSTETRYITISVPLILSITLNRSVIDFGNCTPDIIASWWASNDTSKAGSGAGLCTNLTNPMNFTIENDGNLPGNVSIQASVNDLTGGTNPSLWFSTVNSTLRPGCSLNASHDWKNFTNIDTEYLACERLNATDSNDRFWTYLRVYAPTDATPAERSTVITFVVTQYE
jgi:hypothetical protein